MGRITKPWLGSCIRVCRSVCGLIFWPFMEVSQLQHTRMRTPICTMEQMPLCCCLLKTSRAGCKWGDNLLSRPPLWSVFKTSEKRGDWAGSKFTHVFSVMKIRNLVEGHQFHYFTASLWAVFLSSCSPLPNVIFGAMKKYGYMRIIHLGKSQILTIKVKKNSNFWKIFLKILL